MDSPGGAHMKKNRVLQTVAFLTLAVGVLLLCMWLHHAALLTACVVALGCAALFFRFEKSPISTRELTAIGVMTAVTVSGRLVFVWAQGFKPVTALVVITGMEFGRTAGFLCGALSALLSNFYFGQGMWTPFQMLSWGLIGFGAGLLRRALQRKAILAAYAVFSAVAFSLLMDLWTVLSADGAFSPKRYLAIVLTALPMMGLYAISNLVFLFLLQKPLGKRMQRICVKYGLFADV